MGHHLRYSVIPSAWSKTMNSPFFSKVFLFLCCIVASTAGAQEFYTLEHLQKEATAFAARHSPQRGQPLDLEKAATLGQAAVIMVAAQDCNPALNLYRHSALFAQATDGAFWLAVAEAAACAKQWPETSQSAWLAYQHTPKELVDQRAQALRFAGKALEIRTDSWRNWTPAALAVYERLEEIEKSPFVEEKLSSLRRKKQEDTSLRISGTSVDNENEPPRICLEFNDYMKETNAIHYEDYIRISPALSSNFFVDYRKVCIGGAAYGTSYAVTVRSGLPGKNRRLPEAVTVNIATGPSPPRIWFNQKEYIVADPGNPAFTLHSTNVETVDLEVFRIDERNILTEFVQQYFRSRLDNYDLEKIKEHLGEEVWKGKADIEMVADSKVSSSVLLPSEVLSRAGLYVVVAKDGKREVPSWENQASQWLVVTDIGLSSYQGIDGLSVMARSLATALPLEGLELVVRARNNSLLSSLSTDAQGKVHFPAGLFRGKDGQEAVQIVAADPQHGFTFLQLAQAPFDLSDRGVDGRLAPSYLDAFVSTERGIYRPGESVHVVGLVRNHLGQGVDVPPLTLRLQGPDNKVMLDRLLQPNALGSITNTINLPLAARSGLWTLALYADVEAKALGKTRFEVSSFKPPRLEVRLEPEGFLAPEQSAQVAVQADYLYGSPGSDLAVQARVRFQYEPQPFAEFADFIFGKQGERVDLAEVELEALRTNDKGEALVQVVLAEQYESTVQPLKAIVQTEVLDIDGRAVSASTNLPVYHLKEYIGVKPLFSGQQVPVHSEAAFSVLPVNGQGQVQTSGTLGYRLIREEADYQWFRKDGDWGYERIIRDYEEGQGELHWQEAGPIDLRLPVTQGQYRLELSGTSLLTSFRFTAGEQLMGASDSPDAVQVALDRPQYQVGETARLSLRSPYSGQVSLVLANSSIQDIQHFALNSTEQEIEIPVSDTWGAGVYALVTVYRPGKNQAKGPNRALGLVWLSVLPQAQTLEVLVHSPEQMRPRQQIRIPIEVQGAEAGSAVQVTLAAVDEGVLQLTQFKSPDPLAWFFGKQRLGLELRDLYGHLISPPEGKPLVLRTGAAADGLRGAPISNVQVVSLFSGPVDLNAEGQATVEFDIPNFNGRLRLMALAWSKEKMGSASAALQVNDPVVLSPSLPRYLAQDDRSTIQLLLENIDGPEGSYTLNWQSEGPLNLPPALRSTTLALTQGKRQQLHFPVQATGIGTGSLNLQVQGPEGYSYEGNFALNVRGKYLPVLRRTYSQIPPGATVVLDQESIKGLFPESAKVSLSISPAPNVDVAGLLGQLDRYPYGCLEQVTSRALPLLYANLLASRFAAPIDSQLDGRIQGAIEAILSKQLGEGDFSLWPNMFEGDAWLSAYAMDFLQRARSRGYVVPEYFYSKGIQYLRQQVRDKHNPQSYEMAHLAYSHWVLAQVGLGQHEDARYLFDTKLQQMDSPLAQAQLAGSLALLGDQERSRKGFQAALAAVDSPNRTRRYGSRLRDLAAILSIVGESGIHGLDLGAAWQEIQQLLSTQHYLSTQEQAWLILAALTLEHKEALNLHIVGDAHAAPEEKKAPSLVNRFFSALRIGSKEGRISHNPNFFSIQRSGSSLLHQPVQIENQGSTSVWTVTSVQGTPMEEPAPVAQGFSIERRWYSPTGMFILGEDGVQQGDLLVVSVEGTVVKGLNTQALLVDLLPAGFEIEKPLLNNYDPAFPWLKERSPFDYVDPRDDRFVVAFETRHLPETQDDSHRQYFHYAYLVRAVTPGSYTVAPAEVEAMYKPNQRASSPAGRMLVH